MKRQLLYVAIATAFGAPLCAHAAQPDSAAAAAVAATAAPSATATDAGKKKSTPTQLQAVTVTARKRKETLQDVPIAVTAFTSEKLAIDNVQTLGDLQGKVPNLQIYAARGSNTTLTAYIRGIGQSDPLWGVDPGVGIYLDDVYIARPQGALLDVFDVQRIEVLRDGGSTALYGFRGGNGVILITTKVQDL